MIIRPICSSPFAAMVATLWILSGVSMCVAWLARSSKTIFAAWSMPRLMSILEAKPPSGHVWWHTQRFTSPTPSLG